MQINHPGLVHELLYCLVRPGNVTDVQGFGLEGKMDWLDDTYHAIAVRLVLAAKVMFYPTRVVEELLAADEMARKDRAATVAVHYETAD